MNCIALTIMTVIAAGFLARIIMYARTKNQAYKHDIFVWWRN